MTVWGGRSIHGWVAISAVLLCLGLGACKGEETPEVAVEVVAPDELPAMSVGTAQAIGPHRFAAFLTVTPEEGSSTEEEAEQIECTWLDLTRYSLQRHVDGKLKSQEIRKDDLALRRKGSGKFAWRSPRPGPDVLLKTITPFDKLIARFRCRLVVQSVDLLPNDPDGFTRYALSLAPPPAAAEGESAMEQLERRIRDDGHSALPLELAGEVLVDEFGNRREVTLEGSYRKRSRGDFESGAVAVVYAESRTALGPGSGLVVPPEADVMFAVRRAEIEGDQSDDSVPRGDAP